MARHTTRAGRRAARFLLGLAALAGMLALVVAVPLVLLTAWRYLGPPLPSLHELTGPDDGTLFVRVLCLIGWAGWVTFTWAVLAETLAQWRGWRLPAWSWQQRIAAAMISAVAVMLASPAVVSATASPVRAAPAAIAPPHPTTVQATDPRADATAKAHAGYIEHVVQPGEQMPALAERFLGDKYQWHAIAAATYGITQPDGRELRPGDTRVYPGWTVRIPAPAMGVVTPVSSTTVTKAVDSVTAGTMVYHARHGDWVWYVAERFLGDPLRYPDIARLNPQLATKYGSAFPDHIEPGDTLRLPADAHDRGPRTHATGTVRTLAPPAAGDSPGADPAQNEQPGPVDTEPTTPAPTPSLSATATPPTTPPSAATPPPSPPGTRPAAVPIPGSASPTRTNTPTPAASPSATHGDEPPAHDQPDSGIDLGDRGWVTVEVAAAVAAAAALVWIHRRRRYRPRPPGPARRDDPDLAPLPRTVAALHHSRGTSPTEDDMDASEQQTRDAALVTNASLGSRAGKILRLPDLPALGVGLSGPGAIGAARGLLASVLSAGGPWAPGAEATIITTADDLHRILPGHDHITPRLERLHVADSVEHALDELERHLLRRARLASDTTDLASMLAADDDQAPPPAVFLASAPTGGLATRLAAVLTVGARLALAGVVLGAWPTSQTWQVNPDGTTTVDGHSGPRLNILDPTAALEILDTVQQAHPTADDLPPAPSRPPIAARGADATLAQHQRPVAPATSTSAATAPAPSPPIQPAGPTARRLRLTVLGKPAVQVIDRDQHSDLRIRRKDGVQILIHLAVNPDGATSDELMALVWPEVRPTFSRRQFHTTMSELRQTLAEAAGADPVERTDGRYHLDPQLIDIDLWALNTAIDQAATAVDPAQHAAALRRIIDLYTGAVADGHNWLWLAPYREATRRHIVDAYVALAEGEPQPREALALIQDAIRLDPYNEDLYQHAMRLHARLASPDGVRRTLRTLTERLSELEVRISPQTQQVAAELIERLGTRERIHSERIQHGAA
ncbi:BTAD domain-containing putative transcriptional regulator [Micromonospora globbae]|uniref:BTAD domain-containing putative transcriptional regulator n=1 Tax=Micromonospora globbae TaxID=1894969 RepID=UPI00344921DA